MIRLEEVSLAPGGDLLLWDANWHVRPGARAALVGRNGTGKTTLLRAIVGDEHPWEGRIVVRPGARVGYLPQQAVSGSTKTVWEEVRSAMSGLNALKAALASAEADVTAGDPDAIERHARALDRFRLAGGFAEDQKIGEVLHGLGFGPSTWDQPCDTFSGGWQMRIALARLLLSDPDVALLDEPTNHLDIEARSWLAGHLRSVPWAVVVVSHDRHLLDRVATEVVEVRAGRLHRYAGNFTAFLAQREERIDAQQVSYERQQEEIARLERFVERFRAKATKAAQARSRQNRLDRMERVDAPDAPQKLPRLVLPDAPPGAHEALSLIGASLGWTGGPPVLQGVDLVLERGMRVAVLGPNGAGKSTLLSTLSGRLPPMSGRRKVGDRVRIGVFTQDLAADLPEDATALEHLTGVAPLLGEQRARTILGSLGLSGPDALRPIGQLSGGERARVALAALVARPSNVLLLDEPTNHLDAETVEVLARALRGYEGALLLVTHDRYLVEQLATHVLRVGNGEATLHLGVRPEWLEPIKRVAPDAIADNTPAVEDYEARKRRHREVERARKRAAEIERELVAIEAEQARVDAALLEAATDYARARALGAEHDALVRRHDALFEEWEALELKISALG